MWIVCLACRGDDHTRCTGSQECACPHLRQILDPPANPVRPDVAGGEWADRLGIAAPDPEDPATSPADSSGPGTGLSGRARGSAQAQPSTPAHDQAGRHPSGHAGAAPNAAVGEIDPTNGDDADPIDRADVA